MKIKTIKNKILKQLKFSGLFFFLFSVSVQAAVPNSITNGFQQLYEIVAAVIASIGSLIIMWGLLDFGLSMQSQDGSSQGHSFKRIAGGILIAASPFLAQAFKP